MFNLKKILSAFLTMIMISSSIALIDSASAKPVSFVDEVEVMNVGIPDLQITDLSVDRPLVFLNENNTLTVSLANLGTAIAYILAFII